AISAKQFSGYHLYMVCIFFFFFSSRRRHTRLQGDWSSDVCSSDLVFVRSFSPRPKQENGIFLSGMEPCKEDFTPYSVVTWLVQLDREERRVGKECRSRWSACY